MRTLIASTSLTIRATILSLVALASTTTSFTVLVQSSSSMPASLPSTTTSLFVGGDLFNFGKKKDDETSTRSLPRDVKDAVSRCRASVQKALEKRVSRMTVDMPVGAKYGVEKRAVKKQMKRDLVADVDLDTLRASDRELARLFVDMFQPVGGSAISVVFSDDAAARNAVKTWKGDPTADCRVTSLNKPDASAAGKKKKRSRGFAAKMADATADSESGVGGPFALPNGCEVALFVAPTPRDLVAVQRVCDDVGMGTLVVLLNARVDVEAGDGAFVSEEARTLFTKEFEPVFCLAAAPQDAAPDCLLHRAYPGDWTVARKPKVGQPKIVRVQTDRPTRDECREAYETVEVSEVEGAVETAMESVASWFS